MRAYIDKHPWNDKAFQSEADGFAGNKRAALPARVENESPLLGLALAALQADTDRQLRETYDPAYRLAFYQERVRSDLERQRFEQVSALKMQAFEHHRQQFYKGGFETIAIGADGATRAIPAHYWASDGVLRSVASGEFDDRPIFIKIEKQHRSADSEITEASLVTIAKSPDARRSTAGAGAKSLHATSPIAKLSEFFREHGNKPEFQGIPAGRWQTEAKNAGILFSRKDFQAARRTAVQAGEVTPLKGAPKKAQQFKRTEKRSPASRAKL